VLFGSGESLRNPIAVWSSTGHPDEVDPVRALVTRAADAPTLLSVQISLGSSPRWIEPMTMRISKTVSCSLALSLLSLASGSAAGGTVAEGRPTAPPAAKAATPSSAKASPKASQPGAPAKATSDRAASRQFRGTPSARA